MIDLVHKDLTSTIIGAYYEVYHHISRTYPEYIYERAMLEELRQRGIGAIDQEKYQISLLFMNNKDVLKSKI
jgi:GxxExxY protein